MTSGVEQSPDGHGTAGREPAFAVLSGEFQIRFTDEQATRAAAREATGAGFRVEIRAGGVSDWSIFCQRRAPFPAHEQERYAARLRTIATAYGGDYERFTVE
jgi:hypothetical protein